MFERFSSKRTPNKAEIADVIKEKMLAAEINKAATNARSLLYFNKERFENSSEIIEELNIFENNLEAIEAEIREIPSNSEEDREKLELKLTDLQELYKKIRTLIDKN